MQGYVTRKIVQHARSMATSTRSLPTDSPVPYFQPIERGYMSEGSQKGMYATPYVDPSEHTGNIGGTDYHPDITETDKVYTYTGLDDYDTLFAARHGRGALDPGAAIFTDMAETILNVLDKQVAMSPDTQQTKGLSSSDNQIKGTQGTEPTTSIQKEGYPDLFLPVVENYRISDCFCGYSDSLSTDNNPMVLVELNNLSYRYGTSIYAVDRVNGTMYGKFSVGYRIIPEKATVIPQFQQTLVEDECRPAYENTLPGITNIATPVAKSTPVTQASQPPVIPNVPERDIVEPVSSEKARTAYLE